jgi:hypothetical protein
LQHDLELVALRVEVFHCGQLQTQGILIVRQVDAPDDFYGRIAAPLPVVYFQADDGELGRVAEVADGVGVEDVDAFGAAEPDVTGAAKNTGASVILI